MTDSKKLSKERYTKYAAGYVTSQTHAKGDDLDSLLELAQPQPTWNTLDIATGGGHTALKFAPHVNSVTATDITPTMLQKASEFITQQNITNVDFKEADAESLPFEDNKFDLVTCRIAPHHFPNVAQFVSEAARVLVDGGILLVQDHVLSEDSDVASIADGFEKLRDPSHNHAFSESAWGRVFEDAGLTVEHTEQLTKRHNFVDWADRQGCDDATKAELISILANASEAVRAWMQPDAWQTDDASFVNHHLIIMGRKHG